MAAGAIPVFVSGDLDDSSPYVRPFGEAVPWHDISLHFAWEHAGHIVDTLARLSDARRRAHAARRATRVATSALAPDGTPPHALLAAGEACGVPIPKAEVAASSAPHRARAASSSATVAALFALPRLGRKNDFHVSNSNTAPTVHTMTTRFMKMQLNNNNDTLNSLRTRRQYTAHGTSWRQALHLNTWQKRRMTRSGLYCSPNASHTPLAARSRVIARICASSERRSS